MKELRRHKESEGMPRVVGERMLTPLGILADMRHMLFPMGFEQVVREPGLDIAEIGDKVIVKAELPGMEEKDITTRLVGDMLTISAVKSAKREVRKKDYVYLETRSGAIQRSFRLPRGVTVASKKSHFKDGVLTMEFHKK